MANIKTETITQEIPAAGWAPLDSMARITSQLDAATGRLTGDQQRHYADMPVEQWSEQPSTHHKIIASPDQSVEYRGLTTNGTSWVDPSTGPLYAQAVNRP